MWNQNSLSYGVWSQAFLDVDYIASPFLEHNLILEAWYGVSVALLQLLLSESYVIVSRRPLRFKFSQVNRSAVHWAVPESRSTFVILSLCLASRASLSSPFSSTCCFDFHSVHPFCPASWARVYMNQRQCGNIALRTNRAQRIYGIRTYHIYRQISVFTTSV